MELTQVRSAESEQAAEDRPLEFGPQWALAGPYWLLLEMDLFAKLL